MGLGGGPSEWDEYEWVDLRTLVVKDRVPTRDGRSRDRKADRSGRNQSETAAPSSKDAAIIAAPLPGLPRVTPETVWRSKGGARILLIDLDNLRTRSTRWQIRMGAVVEMAREADHVVIAGQRTAVEKARPFLAEFADLAKPVRFGPSVADKYLIDAAKQARRADGGHRAQFVVASNDFIFSRLAKSGRLTVVSPRVATMSQQLARSAVAVLDLEELEGVARKPLRSTAA